MELNDILYEKKDSIAIETFNRPAVLNAFWQATLHEMLPAQNALNAGLLTHVLAQQQLMEYAIDMADTIASNALLSVRLVKQTMQKTYDLEAVLQLEVEGMMQCLRSEDLVYGFNAFLEKRSLVYNGK